MITPKLKNEAFLQDVANAGTAENRFTVWWLGQSGFLLQWRGKHVLLDPYLSDSLTRKYASTDKPHIRMTELVIDPARLDFIDFATSSHNHTDHLDGETLNPLLEKNPELALICPEANRDFVADRLNIDAQFPIGLDDELQVELHGFTVTGVPAAHEEVERDDQGRCKFLGYILEFGGWRIYHSGDTMLYDGMVEKLRSFGRIDLAILPINGRTPERRVAGNLNGEEAASLGKLLEAGLVIPCHYDMFTFNTADPRIFAEAAQKIGQPYKILQCGERWTPPASEFNLSVSA